MRPVHVMLVDDDDAKLNALARSLERSSDPEFTVDPFSCPYQALQHLMRNPHTTEFVFIDHVIKAFRPRYCPPEIGPLGDGIAVARSISERWPHIGIILYSGDLSISRRQEWQGLAAGAHRYVRVQTPEQLLDAAPRELISEIRELRELREALDRFHKDQAANAILQQSLPVGIDVIDRNFKVWYRNETLNKIVGTFGHEHQFCCSKFHRRLWPPCPGCLVCKSLQIPYEEWIKNPKRVDRIFYSPVFPKGEREFRYMHVWVRPIYSTDKPSLPIAATESVIDLTESPTVEEMSLKDHLAIILHAIEELNFEKTDADPPLVVLQDDAEPEVGHAGYSRVRVYLKDRQDEVSVIRLVSVWGHTKDEQNRLIDERFVLNCEPTAVSSGVRVRLCERPHSYYDIEAVNAVVGTENPMEFILYGSDGEWIGWLAIDAKGPSDETRPATSDDCLLLEPYADEIATILEKRLHREYLVTDSPSESSAIVEGVQSSIVHATDLEGALQILVEAIVGERSIEMGHVRVVKDDNLEIIAGKGAYYEQARARRAFLNAYSATRRVAASGSAIVINHAADWRLKRSVEIMPDELRSIMRQVQSMGAFPIKVQGKVQAVFTVHSLEEEAFTPDVVVLCNRLAEIASYAMHDVTLKEETEKRTAEIWKQAAASFTHRIGNTLPIAQLHLNHIHRYVGDSEPISRHAGNALDAVNRAMEIARRYQEHSAKVPLKLESHRGSDVVERISEYCMRQQQGAFCEFATNDCVERVIVLVDVAALQDVFSALITDSVRFHAESKPQIRIEVGCLSSSASQPTLSLTYQDDGPGIEAELKERVFEPFFTTSPKGTGIGLADVKEVVNGHQGTIVETGTPGQGVRFEILIPAQIERETEADDDAD